MERASQAALISCPIQAEGDAEGSHEDHSPLHQVGSTTYAAQQTLVPSKPVPQHPQQGAEWKASAASVQLEVRQRGRTRGSKDCHFAPVRLAVPVTGSWAGWCGRHQAPVGWLGWQPAPIGGLADRDGNLLQCQGLAGEGGSLLL